MKTRLDRIELSAERATPDHEIRSVDIDDIVALTRAARHLQKLHRNAIARGRTMGAEFDKHELAHIELEMETPVVLAPLLEEV